ncbi:hypothetical protein NPIL_548561 [Nephila pilipes]|uniref:Uncharacterized protein n=1 Tax=Nephila pilipes TaxID=299642 RepID=A0A8X6PDS2_NEPPI|nr:hypothetical protein NPIL_548561 [Nephila pilipes]
MLVASSNKSSRRLYLDAKISQRSLVRILCRDLGMEPETSHHARHGWNSCPKDRNGLASKYWTYSISTLRDMGAKLKTYKQIPALIAL